MTIPRGLHTNEEADAAVIPERLRRALSLFFTLGAALCYAYILGLAEARTYLEGAPIFTENMARAAGLLSGLVGAVVAAGFAQGHILPPAPASAAHAMGGIARTGWVSLRRPRARYKFLGLGHILGLQGRPRTTASAQPGACDAESAHGRNANLVAAVGALYFVVYLIIGAVALALTITRPVVPDLIANAGWVWLGAMISAAYTYLRAS